MNTSNLQELKQWFASKGLTQKEIADQLGVTQSYVSNIFAGARTFNNRSAVLWNAVFGLNVDFLLNDRKPIESKDFDVNLIRPKQSQPTHASEEIAILLDQNSKLIEQNAKLITIIANLTK